MKLNSLIVGLTLSLAIVAMGHAQAPNRATANDTSTPTFTRDVAPIMFTKCASCHRPGEVAPMPLLSYSDARPWASAIKQKVSTRAMPPWHADPAHGAFRNRPASERQGNRHDRPLGRWRCAGRRSVSSAGAPTFPEGWQIGKPDAVFEMAQDFEVPPSGEIAYQYFEVPTNFTEDKWMQAGEVRAGDRSHVHHIIVYVREPGRTVRPNVVTVRPIPMHRGGTVASSGDHRASRRALPAAAARAAASGRRSRDRRRGCADGRPAAAMRCSSTGPSARTRRSPAGTAKRIPAGSTLIFQVHYTTNGKAGRDRSKIGLVFAKEPPQREIRTG
jgi:hypothetical protein